MSKVLTSKAKIIRNSTCYILICVHHFLYVECCTTAIFLSYFFNSSINFILKNISDLSCVRFFPISSFISLFHCDTLLYFNNRSIK